MSKANDERWSSRAIDSVAMTPMYWFDKTQGRLILKLLSLLWFLLLLIPCGLVAFLLAVLDLPLMIWDEME